MARLTVERGAGASSEDVEHDTGGVHGGAVHGRTSWRHDARVTQVHDGVTFKRDVQ